MYFGGAKMGVFINVEGTYGQTVYKMSKNLQSSM